MSNSPLRFNDAPIPSKAGQSPTKKNKYSLKQAKPIFKAVNIRMRQNYYDMLVKLVEELNEDSTFKHTKTSAIEMGIKLISKNPKKAMKEAENI